jgi:hypothetical protein
VTVGAGEHAVKYHAPVAATVRLGACTGAAVIENEGLDDVEVAPSA